MADFLLEVGTEEIPDWMIEPALADLQSRFQAAFGDFGGSAIDVDGTPRRLVLLAKDMIERAPDVESLVMGPYLAAGPKAAEGFARKNNSSVAELEKSSDAKGERYVSKQLVQGRRAEEVLQEKLPEVILGLYFPKTMYWTGKGGPRFIRPIRWLVALFEDRVVPFSVAGVQSGNTTRGHRTLGSCGPIPVMIESYKDLLKANAVIVEAAERKSRIEAALGANVARDEELLRTLVYLTEFPCSVSGNFDPSFLDLPKEILSTVMRHHQRYFMVTREDGSLAPEFIAITNTDGDPDGLIRQGNERVLRARFNDARFFWQVDQNRKLRERLDDLAKVTFFAKLGTYRDKTSRIVELAGELASETGADENSLRAAAELAKTDLTTEMVKEFTELQGVVGGLYARVQGEGERVALAIYDQYKPTSMEDSLPRTLEGQLLSIADKTDTLRQCFRIGLIPSGSKDPFALRRAAQGVVRILFEAKLPIPLSKLAGDIPQLMPFFRERLEFYLREVLNYAYDEVNAVLVPQVTTLSDLAERAEAVHSIRPTEDFEPLAASFKRIKNILKQAQFTAPDPPKAELLSLGPEKELYDAYINTSRALKSDGSYHRKLESIASIRPQVDRFFDKILVNDTNQTIRRNRLALLYSLLTEFSTIADFSEIVTQGGTA